MPRPFEQHIPRFPEYTTPEGMQISAETNPQLPSQETSQFTKPHVAESTTLISRYINPDANARTRESVLKEAVIFCTVPEQGTVFTTTLDQMFSQLQNTELNISISTQARLRRYQDLEEKIGERLVRSQALKVPTESVLSVDNTPQDLDKPREVVNGIAFPKESVVKMPEKPISLANDALRQKYPREYGKIIRVLHLSDIHVISDKDLLRFQRQVAAKETHSFRISEGERVNMALYGRVGSDFSQKEGNVMVQTVPFFTGYPIFMPETEITGVQKSKGPQEIKKAVLDVVLAKTLIHENIHRTTTLSTPRPVQVDDPLFQLAFSADQITASLQRTPRVREALKTFRETLIQYAQSHDPMIQIEGVRVKALCRDEDGEYKVIAESGYDLQECIVDSLAINAINPVLTGYLQRNFSQKTAVDITQFIHNTYISDANYRYQNVLPQMMEYLKELRLTTPIDVLKAFSEGRIPQLHVQKMKSHPYFI